VKLTTDAVRQTLSSRRAARDVLDMATTDADVAEIVVIVLKPGA
jgi:hypothetical protein